MDRARLILLLLLVPLIFLAFTPSLAEATEPSKYEYYDGTPTSSFLIAGSTWAGQSFTVGVVGDNVAFNVTSIRLYLYRLGAPGNLNVSVRATSSGLPSGNDLASGVINANTLTSNPFGAWTWINMSVYGNSVLQPSTQYAIVARAPSGSVGNGVYWQLQGSDAYSGGLALQSLTGGSVWLYLAVGIYDFNFEVWGQRVWGYTFKGIYDEETGLLESASQRAVNVTAYFSNAVSVTFEVNGTYVYAPSAQPLYFRYALATPREYWLSLIENYGDTYYIFNSTLLPYTISFLDLGGILKTTPFISAQRYINGTYVTVEKRRVDIENKVQFKLAEGEKYKILVSDTVVSHVFGDLQTTSDTTITLTIHGIQFPKETILIYKYVRIYGLRTFDDPTGTITINYQDTLNLTTSVTIWISYRNGTIAYSTIEYADTFSLVWLNADNSTDYQVTATINHQRFGTYDWKQWFTRGYSTNPWVLGWLGSLSFDVNYIISIFLVIAVGAGFSMINPEIGAFLASCVAAGLTIMGWLPIPPGLLITAFCFSLMFGIIIARRRVTYAY